VNAAAAARLQLSADSQTVEAGMIVRVTVTVYDAFGNIATGYAGTVSFSSDDGLATLPDDYQFTADDRGVHTFEVAFQTPGPVRLRVRADQPFPTPDELDFFVV
jgi:adhesin/invasin